MEMNLKLAQIKDKTGIDLKDFRLGLQIAFDSVENVKKPCILLEKRNSEPNNVSKEQIKKMTGFDMDGVKLEFGVMGSTLYVLKTSDPNDETLSFGAMIFNDGPQYKVIGKIEFEHEQFVGFID